MSTAQNTARQQAPCKDFPASHDRLNEALTALLGAATQAGAFGAVTVHITPAQDANALPVQRWVHDAQVLLACLRAIEPAAKIRINVAGLGAMHHMALHEAGVDVGRFVPMVDYAPALELIPEALRPCKHTGLPVRHAVLDDPRGLS